MNVAVIQHDGRKTAFSVAVGDSVLGRDQHGRVFELTVVPDGVELELGALAFPVSDSVSVRRYAR